MNLIKPENAILNYSTYGPIFGSGCDFRIYDKANENNNSFANFPSSYNNGQYQQNNQQSYTAFSGQPKGYNFKIV